ncbi:MAG: S-methyl-5-thioribose-1-phosphate isomerase [Deltaproteobacteria bacterium]|nr:S-methyl-5-thioribose-1-phosphate isomerase [Deltaproteobacteria bacterium]
MSGADFSAVELDQDGTRLYLLDQRRLPHEEQYLTCADPESAAAAIGDMVVRGAPAIGITAAYGMVLAAGAAVDRSADDYLSWMSGAAGVLTAARPTAVNLGWAVARCLELAARHRGAGGADRWEQMAELARQIHRDDVAACRAMGRIGAELLGDPVTVLTHCNTGALATGGYGTALGVIRAAVESRKQVKVYACETRPYLQGARLTAWELHREGIDVTVITDSMVGHCMSQGRINAVVVGTDRVAANGDVANKIGTYGIACLAECHRIPFYVATPWSTIDLDTPTGGDIPIEERAADELTQLAGQRLTPAGVGVYNPAFDVTPARLVAAIITEEGAFEPAELAQVDLG